VVVAAGEGEAAAGRALPLARNARRAGPGRIS